MKSTIFEERFATHPADAKSYDTDRLRKEYLIGSVMVEDKISLTYSQYDRYIVGGAVPVSESLTLMPIDPLKAEYFCERREIGIINVGGNGTVTIDGTIYHIGFKEALYIGRGSKLIVFSSVNYCFFSSMELLYEFSSVFVFNECVSSSCLVSFM